MNDPCAVFPVSAAGSGDSAEVGAGKKQQDKKFQEATGSNGGVAATEEKEEKSDVAPLELPQAVMQMVATSLQCDVLVAALVQKPMNLAETVLCVPTGMITVPVRLSRVVIEAAARCKVVSTEGMLLPSLLSATLGDRPRSLLATQCRMEGHQGICYALWLDPDSVPAQCEQVMEEAGLALPQLLAAQVRTSCLNRMGRRFDVILMAMPQAVVFLDAGVGPCLLNPAASELLGLHGAGEVDNKVLATGMCRLADRCVPRYTAYRCFKQVAVNREQVFQWDWEVKEPRRVYRVRSCPVTKNSTHGRIWFFDDITAEWDARLAMEAADKAKTQFLAMMSHVLRTPMTGVLGMQELLRLTSLSPEQDGFVRVMQRSAEGLIQVLDEILDFSSISSGQFTLEETDFHIGELLEQVCALFQGRLAEKKLQLTVRMPDVQHLAVRGDERIRQVLTNLVSNAIKFTETGGIDIIWLPVSGVTGPADEVDVKPGDVATSPHLASNGHHAQEGKQPSRMWHEVRVRDTGMGLTKEQQSRLFQSFSQADTSTTRKFGGTGLGLAISKGLVTAMEGRIWVESEAGKGSTFAFCIPLIPAQHPSEHSQSRHDASDASSPKSCSLKKLRSLKVLAAEDNKVSQLLLQTMLRHYGHEVQMVPNGQLAVQAIQSAHYDMVLMDLQMPVLDGLSATKQIRSLGGQASKVPIYALTADVLTRGQETLEAMGLDGYLTKPINWETLSHVIDTVISDTPTNKS